MVFGADNWLDALHIGGILDGIKDTSLWKAANDPNRV
jgi:hypothetical protein